VIDHGGREAVNSERSALASSSIHASSGQRTMRHPAARAAASITAHRLTLTAHR
jgi:hypothetical protein